MMFQARGFQEVSVARLGYQTAGQRFGTSRIPQSPPLEDSDSEDEQDVDNTHALPRIEEWRMNLTCLSQYNNLYFAAYGDKIYVYRPQNPQQTLPREPNLILEPPQSPEAVRSNAILGISRYQGHVINHLVVGDLGGKEILICACSDGDVIAYYTEAIENTLQRSASVSLNTIKLLFAENVGNSAWGLAIHSQSRLIAVGSNSHEIQVFAFALSASARRKPTSTIRAQLQEHSTLPPGHTLFPKIKQVDIPRTNGGEVVRDQNFRLIFKLQGVGDNIPSVAFSNSIHGDAYTVIAADIRGALWFFRLWEGGWKRLPSTCEPPDPHRNPIGWGVIVLPRDFFKPTHDLADTFGWPKSYPPLNLRREMIDISKTVKCVRDSSVLHEASDTDDREDDDDNNDDNDDDNDDDSDDDEGQEDDLEDFVIVANMLSDREFEMLTAQEDTDSSAGEEQDMVINVPEEEETDTLLMGQPLLTPFLSPQSISAPIGPISADKAAHERLKDDFCLSRSGELILQSYRHRIILNPTDNDWVPTRCNNLLRQELPHDIWFPRPLADYDRLNMLATIPELSLVLVASQVGRVALITITRPVGSHSRLGHIVAMRVDLILPFTHEESNEKIRPSHGLLGVAVGPMQSGPANMAERKTRQKQKRWRLMLHYFNHTILCYEVSRDEENGALLVV